jgi:hypothetical protein
MPAATASIRKAAGSVDMERKREEGIFEILATLPWWISVVVAFLVYVFLRSMLPTLVGSSVILKGLAQGLQPNAWIFAALFLIPIPFSLLNSLSGGKLRRPSTTRRRQEGIFDMLAALPWWVSVVVAGIAYVFFKWVFPGLAGQSVFLKVMAQAFQGNAGLVSCLFLIPAPIAFFNASRRRKLLDSQTGIESRLEETLAPSEPTLRAAKTCPVCGGEMATRIAKRGPNAGKPFWGCSRYPRCKGTRPI